MVISKIEYRGRSSDELSMLVSYPVELAHADPDVDSISVPGVNGDIIQDNLRYKNIDQTISFIVRNNLGQHNPREFGRAITNWIAGNDYSPLKSDLINGYEWEALVDKAPTVVQTDINEATVEISFNCKPFLKSLEGQEWQAVPSNPTNLERWSAEPLWHIKGTGNLVLTVNDLDYKLNGIDDEVYIDSERGLVYKSLAESRAGLAVFPGNDFPILTPGDNSIKLTGDYNLFEYKPNWRCLA